MKALCSVVVLCFACSSEQALPDETSDANDSSSQRDGGRADDDEAGANDSDDSQGTDAGSDGSGSVAPPPGGECALSDAEREERCADFDDARPDRLSEHTAVYDPTRSQLVVTGGTEDIPVNCATDGTSEFAASTWIFDDPCEKWRRGADIPSPRGRHSAAWADGAMWVFGGRYRAGDSGNYTLFNDLLRYDIAVDEWEAVDADGTPPLPRATSALAWDSKRNMLWMFAGNLAESGLVYMPTDDLWSFDIDSSTWEPRVTEVVPPRRLFHSMIYDEQRDWLVVFGGGNETAFDSFPVYFGDLWAYDIAAGEWLELAGQDAGPIGRFWSTLIHETVSDTYVAFGGHDPGTLVTRDETLGNLNDQWRFDPDVGTWEVIAQGDVFNEPNVGFCNFPPDFAAIDPELPERRMSHSFVWSESCGHGLLFAGKTDCGSTDDVWRFSANTWAEVLPAREGEVCHRWRDDIERCTDICF